MRNKVNNWKKVSFFVLTYKTKHWVGFFAWTCKIKYTTDWSLLLRDGKRQHKYIVSNSGWKLSAIITKLGDGWVTEKKCSRWEKINKWISGRRGVGSLGMGGVWTSMRHSRVGTKFRLKMSLLNFWVKLTQKGYFWTKKMKIIIEFYIFKLILIVNFSFNKQFGLLEQI